MNYREFINSKVEMDADFSASIQEQKPSELPSRARGVAFASPVEIDAKEKGEMALEFSQEDSFTETIVVTPNDIRTIWKNPIINTTFSKIENYIFEGAELLAVPPDDQANTVTKEELQEVQNMVETIDKYRFRTLLRMKQANRDTKKYGSALFERINGTIKSVGNKSFNGPVVFKRLPAYSFDTQPTLMMDAERYVPGELLKGIVFDVQTFDISYWQRQSLSGDPIQLKNEYIIHVRDEMAESPDGESLLSTVVPLVRKLNFADQCLMRAVMRAGAPNLDVIVKEYRDQAAPMNADAWDMGKAFEEGKKIGKNWSNSTVLEHPDCIELKTLDWSKMAIDPIKVVDFINKRILYALIPMDLTESKSSALSNSGNTSLDTLNLWAKGEQTKIEEPFLREWDNILAENGKEGWRVEIVWREMTPDSARDLWDCVRIARDVGVFTPDEMRELVQYPPLTDDQREEIDQIPAKGNNPGGKVGFSEEPDGEEPDGSSPSDGNGASVNGEKLPAWKSGDGSKGSGQDNKGASPAPSLVRNRKKGKRKV